MDAFWTIVAIVLILWFLGFIVLPGLGAIIHILLVIALVVIVYRLVTGKKIL